MNQSCCLMDVFKLEVVGTQSWETSRGYESPVGLWKAGESHYRVVSEKHLYSLTSTLNESHCEV